MKQKILPALYSRRRHSFAGASGSCPAWFRAKRERAAEAKRGEPQERADAVLQNLCCDENKEWQGFTLIEVVMVLFVFSIIVYGTILLIGNIFTGSNKQFAVLSDLDQARKVSSTFVSEVRDATVGNDGSFPLNQASATQIVIFTTYGSTAPAINRVRYYISGNTLYKGVVVPTGNPLSYNLATETVTVVQNNLANGGNAVFTYYNGNYNGSQSALTQPVNFNQVTYVQINLTIQNRSGVINANTYSISSGSAIRNLKTNWGS